MFDGSVSRSVVAAALLGAIVGVPRLAEAQVYKCTRPDGSTSFQGMPCASNTKTPPPPTSAERNAAAAMATPAAQKSVSDPYAPDSGRWTLPAAPPRNEAPAQAATSTRGARPVEAQAQTASPMRRAGDADREVALKQMQLENERATAFNRNQRCNYARQQLGVATSERPIHHYNDKGEKVYVEDKDRQALINANQQQVSQECR